MEGKKETIHTEVDNLIELIKKNKEISFDEAANQLGVPILTIESWANFLEEEGLVSINYKFTTPYLSYESPDSVTNKENLDDMVKKSSELEEAFSLLSNTLEKEDYNTAHKESIEIHKKVNALLDSVKKDKELSKRIDQTNLHQRLDGFLNFLNHAKSLMAKKDVERLKSAFKQIHSELSDIFVEIKEPISQIQTDRANKIALQTESEKRDYDDNFENKSKDDLNLNVKEKSGDSKGSTEENKKESKSNLANELISNFKSKNKNIESYNELIKNAYLLISQGEIEQVKQIYEVLESDFNSLPNKFKENRGRLKEALLKINSDIASHVSKTSSETVESISKQISDLITQAKSELNAQNFKSAENTYATIESLYNKLPVGFIETKIDLENRMIDLHSDLINKESTKYSKDTLKEEEKIYALISQIEELLSLDKIDEAFKIYSLIKEVYNSLPSGFIGNKLEIQNKIFHIYQKILVSKERDSEKDFKKKAIKISEISKQIELMIQKDDYSSSLKLLREANFIFDSLPEGFLKYKSQIETNLLTISKKVSILEKEHSTKKFNLIKSKIEKLFLKMQNYIEHKEYDLAEETYKEIVSLYNEFPTGFLKEKTDIKKNILESYRQIMLNSDSVSLNDVKEEVKVKYDSLLKLLMSVHESIEEKDFDLIENKYNHIVSLYNDLPIGFIQQRISIRHEILKIYDEVQLFKLSKKLDEAFAVKDIEKMKGLMGTIYTLYNELFDECKEDIVLFNYIKEIYDYYESSLRDEGHNVKKIPIVDNLNVSSFEKSNERKSNKENIMFVKEKNKSSYSNSLYEKAIALLLAGKLEDSYSNLKMIGDIDTLNNKSEYLMGIIIKIKHSEVQENYGEEINLFMSILEELNSRKLDSLEAKLARMKLIRSFYEYLHGNLMASLVDMKKLTEIYYSNLQIRRMLEIMELKV